MAALSPAVASRTDNSAPITKKEFNCHGHFYNVDYLLQEIYSWKRNNPMLHEDRDFFGIFFLIREQ
jgi:hypothetical protein